MVGGHLRLTPAQGGGLVAAPYQAQGRHRGPSAWQRHWAVAPRRAHHGEVVAPHGLYSRARHQRIRFTTAPDGSRLAYATHGRGYPLVRAAHWFTHLQYDWESPVWQPWLAELGRRFTVLRYDERGCGLAAGGIDPPPGSPGWGVARSRRPPRCPARTQQSRSRRCGRCVTAAGGGCAGCPWSPSYHAPMRRLVPIAGVTTAGSASPRPVDRDTIGRPRMALAAALLIAG